MQNSLGPSYSAKPGLIGKHSKEVKMLFAQQHENCDATITSTPSDEGFISMLDKYRATGGIANANELTQRPLIGKNGDINALAKQIFMGEVFSFEWQGKFWIPLFQFNPKELTSRQCVRQVLGELTNVFDGWTMAAWFVQANAWLEHKKPIDLLDCGLSSVLHAARADRYVAMG
jgi:hypothetical protein